MNSPTVRRAEGSPLAAQRRPMGVADGQAMPATIKGGVRSGTAVHSRWRCQGGARARCGC